MDRLKAVLRGSRPSDEANRIWRDHERLIAQMVAYETAKLANWCAAIADVSEQTLKQPLLRCAAPLEKLNHSSSLLCCVERYCSIQYRHPSKHQ